MSDERDRATSLEDVLSAARMMRDFPGQWWVAGGWAIDLWLGEVTRQHSDVEISIWREDQLALREHWARAGWEWLRVRDEKWAAWERDPLELPEHQLMARQGDREVEFFLNEREGDMWVARRDPRVRVPVDRLILSSERWKIPILAPEVQLLYKAKWTRAKDRIDYARAMARMSDAQKTWLRESVSIVHPGHEWAVDAPATGERGDAGGDRQ